ncbi:hypothetical protein JCM10213_008735 [Rhodosporidiobolus nylandii]
MADPDLQTAAPGSSSPLRLRSATRTGSEGVAPSPSPAGSATQTSWQAQLAEARVAMAHRFEQQQHGDGWRSADDPGETVAEEQAGHAEEGGTKERRQRRESVASSAGDENEDEAVAQMLRPGSQAADHPCRKAIPEERRKPEEDCQAEDADTRICRICFDGHDEELGKLFSPCRCSGTARFVHQACLERWRKAARNERSFYACDLCQYKYKFRRTTAARLLTSKITVTLITSWAFLFLVFVSGFLANSLLSVVEARNAALQNSMLSDFWVADHILLGEGVREAVSFVGHQLEESRWAAGREQAIQKAIHGGKLVPEEGETAGGTGYRYVNPLPGGQIVAADEPPLLLRALVHLTKGSALIGIMSVFYTYVAATFVSPLGRTLFRAIRPAGTRRRHDSASISQVVIVLLVILGVVRSIRQTYRGVRWLTRRVLGRVEDLVLDVGAS